jgi:hypothetical protein
MPRRGAAIGPVPLGMMRMVVWLRGLRVEGQAGLGEELADELWGYWMLLRQSLTMAAS